MAYTVQVELKYLNEQMNSDYRNVVDARNAFYSNLPKEKAPVPVKEKEPVKVKQKATKE